MGSLGSINIRVDKLPKERFVKGKDGAVYCDISFSINDDSKFGNNVSVMIPQSKEEREAKKPKQYLGNGKIFWTDGVIKLAEKEIEDSGLPF